MSAGSFRRRIEAFPVCASACSIHEGSIDASNRARPRGPIAAKSSRISENCSKA